MVWKNLKFLGEKTYGKKRLVKLVDKLTPLLKDSKKVLDVGTGTGMIPHAILKNIPKIKFTGIDVYLPKKKFISVKKYDGTKIPFPKNSFDTVMMVDVLHHTKDIKKVLEEVKRVTKRNIIIKDHYYNNKLELPKLKIFDYLGNKPYGVPTPYNFLKIEEFNQLFKELNLKKVKVQKFKYMPFDVNQVIFKLKKYL